MHTLYLAARSACSINDQWRPRHAEQYDRALIEGSQKQCYCFERNAGCWDQTRRLMWIMLTTMSLVDFIEKEINQRFHDAKDYLKAPIVDAMLNMNVSYLTWGVCSEAIFKDERFFCHFPSSYVEKIFFENILCLLLFSFAIEYSGWKIFFSLARINVMK